MILLQVDTLLVVSSFHLYKFDVVSAYYENTFAYNIRYDILCLCKLQNGHIACGTKEHVILFIDQEIELINVLE
jgi:hypothetical protein